MLAARSHEIGEAVTVQVVRNGKPQTFTLTLAEKPLIKEGRCGGLGPGGRRGGR